MNKKRPVNLELTSIKLPLTAYASILHRISGFLMIFIVAFLLAVLSCSLSTEEGFDQVYHLLHLPWVKFVVWLMLSAVVYHFIAGIKHLIMDMGFAEGEASGRAAAIVSFVLAAIAIVLLGVWMVW